MHRIVIALAVIVAACSANRDPARGEDKVAIAAANPQLTSLQLVLRDLRPDGSWSKETALQAFAAVYGELPGVTAPKGARAKAEYGAIAVRMLELYWDRITPAQRAAATARLPANHAQVFRTPAIGAAVLGVPAVNPSGPSERHEAIAADIVADIGARVGRKLAFVPAVVFVREQVGATQALTKGDAAGCTIFLYPVGYQYPVESPETRSVLAHEIWHCFQYARLNKDAILNRPPWIIEGQAMWVGEQYVGGSHGIETTGRHWPEYVMTPGESLFHRTYDAIGFYSHLVDQHVDVWQILDPVLDAGTDNVYAFKQAIGASNLATWGASWFFETLPPTNLFDLVNAPGLIRGRQPPRKMISLAEGQGDALVLKARAAGAIADVRVKADVLRVAIAGHGILGDLAGPVFMFEDSTQMFCVKSPCKCPDNSTPLDKLTPISDHAYLAITNGAKNQSSAQLVAFTMADLCKVKPERWHGTWKSSVHPISGTFELSYKLTGTQMSGEVSVAGSDCVAAGPVQGAVDKGRVEFGSVAAGPGVTWTGALKTATMSGNYTSPGCGEDSGTWSATRR